MLIPRSSFANSGRRLRRARSFRIGFLSLLLTVGSSLAQDSPRASFDDTLEVRVFNFEVVVEDPNGQPIPGLRAEDLRLWVDGEAVPIEFFSEVREGRVASTDPKLPQPGEALDDGTVPVSYLVFVDELFSPVALRNEALRKMALEVDSLREADRMAVVAFSGHRAKVLTPWLGDRQKLRRLFAEASTNKASLVGKGLIELTSSLKYDKALRAGSFHAGGDKGDPGSAAVAEAERQIRRDEISGMARSMSAAVDALHAMGDVPGRKALILLTGGWPASLGGAAESVRGGNPLWALVDAANALGYGLFPIQLGGGGMEVAAGDGAGQRERGIPGAGQALADLASQTGGRLLEMGGKSYLGRVSEEVGTFYWLGISDHRPASDRRQIRVEVTRPGLKARTRKSYVHLPLREVKTRQAAAALRTGLRDSSAAALQVTVGEIKKAGRKKLEVPLILEFPLEGLTLLPAQGGVVASLELRLASLDASGRDAPIPVIPLELPFPGQPPPGQKVIYEITVRLRNKAQTLQLTLHDKAGDRVLSASLPIEP